MSKPNQLSRTLLPKEIISLKNELPLAFLVDFQAFHPDNYDQFMKNYLDEIKSEIVSKFDNPENKLERIIKGHLNAAQFPIMEGSSTFLVVCAKTPAFLSDSLKAIYQVGLDATQVAEIFQANKNKIKQAFINFESEELKEIIDIDSKKKNGNYKL